MNLKPFFTYYGGKWRASPHYPKPLHDTIIEPFAGAAGYSVRYPEKKVILIEKYKRIADMWKWLVNSSEEEILNLPTIITNINDLNVCEEAKTLLGFWLNKGSASPCVTPSKWMREDLRPNQFWGKIIQARTASQVEFIKHWEVIYGDYTDAPDIEATWFIDPPYHQAGKHYKHGSSQIDYKFLADWCKSRKGQVIVCENEGADWLPFETFKTIKGMSGKNRTKISKEVIWYKD